MGGAQQGTQNSTATGNIVEPQALFPRTGITANQLGVLVNDDDPLSVSIAEYYVTARNIPDANVVHLHVGAGNPSSIAKAAFDPLKAQVDAAFMNTDVQAMAITWTKPFAVDNMSVTSAFALGYKAMGDTCNDVASQSGTLNPYQTKPDSTTPFTDLAFRPAMTIPATTLAEAQPIIDRGVSYDGTSPMGTAYLMDTSDQVRSARCIVNPTYGYTNECQTFLDTWDTGKTGIGASIINADPIMGKTDVLFYVQGLQIVPDLMTNTFIPGSVADHLTSFGDRFPSPDR